MKNLFTAVGRLARAGRPVRTSPLPQRLFRAVALALLTPLGVAQAQVVTITGTAPAVNARSAVRTGPVVVTFSQTLTTGSEAALKVYSAQHGGLRSVATPVVRSGSTLTFTPSAARPFMPGETVFSTVTRTAAGSGGTLAAAKVYQLTAAAGAGPGTFSGGSDPAVDAGPISVALGDVDGDGDLDLLTANANDNTVSVRLNQPPGPVLTALCVSAELPGLPVTLTGTGFSSTSTVSFGGVASPGVTFVSATTLTATVPVSAAAGSSAVVVPNATGPSASAPAFTVLEVYNGGTLGACAAALPATATANDGAWHYLLSAAFDVERSPDGVAFERLGTVAAAGHSSSPRSYALTDARLPAGATLLYYRLRLVDANGRFGYSPVRSVAPKTPAPELVLVPNPVHGGTATLTGAVPGTVVTVFDALGRLVASAPANATGTAALALPAGLYVVRAGRKSLRLVVE